jgi:hypothetical protein
MAVGVSLTVERFKKNYINGTKRTGLVVAHNPTAKHFSDGKQISTCPNQFPVHK